ncbi:MAG: hypothetical protein V7709_07695 [Halioglobus sp.]
MNSSDNSDIPLDTLQAHYGVAYPTPFRELACALCTSSTRYLKILSPHLDHTIFDSVEVADAISALARSDSHSRVQILISDSRPILQKGHRLLSLSRRLPSSVIFRKLSDHPEMKGQTVLVGDLDKVLFMPGDEGPGFYDPDSRASAKQFTDKFDSLWERGVADPGFRRLGL